MTSTFISNHFYIILLDKQVRIYLESYTAYI